MDRTRLPDDIRALNAKLTADPALTENMGPVHVLTVVGRRSGTPQTTPVSPVMHDGHRWLVAVWADADWVKNLRASGWATLTKGIRVERIRAVEVPPEQSALASHAFVQERGGRRMAG
jgi:deazaflavin-dependent oxidoreductase (nitroreductase family)